MDQSAWVAAGALIVGAVLGAAGAIASGVVAASAALKGAKLSAEQLKEDRLARHEERLGEQLTALAGEFLARTERHVHEIRIQRQAWVRVSDGKDKPDSIAPVGPIGDLEEVVARLYIVGRQETADAAWNLYLSLRDGLDWLVYDAGRDRLGDSVHALKPDDWDRYFSAQNQYTSMKTLFLDRVRTELNLLVLQPNALVFPEKGPVAELVAAMAPPVSTILGSSFTSKPVLEQHPPQE